MNSTEEIYVDNQVCYFYQIRINRRKAESQWKATRGALPGQCRQWQDALSFSSGPLKKCVVAIYTNARDF